MEHLKYKLIMERHEREKEHSDHSAIMKYIDNYDNLINNNK